ncbi:unnamed protein product [Gadus morhua 'NCC']
MGAACGQPQTPGGGASLRPPEAEPASDPRRRSQPQTPGGGASLRPQEAEPASDPGECGGGASLRTRGVRRRSLITTRQTGPGASAQELPTQRRSV